MVTSLKFLFLLPQRAIAIYLFDLKKKYVGELMIDYLKQRERREETTQ
jgi:hypothetical protein